MDGLKGLGKQAEDAVHATASSLTHLSGLASASSSDFLGLVGLLTSAAEDVGGLGAGLDGIELNTLDSTDIPRVVEIQNANRALYTELKDTLNDIARFLTRPPQGLQSLKKRAPAYIAGGAVIGFLAKGPSAVIGFQPHAKTTKASSAPSQSTNSKDDDNEWFFNTVPGTTKEEFQKFITSLPDKGIGPKTYIDWPVRYQTYVAKLTLEQAKAVNRELIVDQLVANKRVPVIDQLDSRGKGQLLYADEGSNQTKLHSRQNGWGIQSRLESGLHLRMISARPEQNLGDLENSLEDPQHDYTYVNTLGDGATVYVIDSGFDFTHAEFARGPMLEPEFFIPPYFGNIAINAGSTHGTQVASMAVGVRLGVATKARLVGVKTANAKNVDSWGSFFEIWAWLLHDVQTKGLAGKAVINFSYGYRWYFQIMANMHVDYQLLGIPQPEESDGYLPVLRDCWAAGIVTVFAAANGEGVPMGELSPQRFATPGNPMIVVGSVNRRGFKSRFNRHPGPAANARGRDLACVGELTLFALGKDISTVDPDGPDYLVSIFKRQDRKDDTVTIFENGHLTDPKYSDKFTCKLPGGNDPNSKSPSKPAPTPSSKTSTPPPSSKSSAPPPPPPTPTPTSGPETNQGCYRKGHPTLEHPPDGGDVAIFHRPDMSTLIAHICHIKHDYAIKETKLVDNSKTVLHITSIDYNHTVYSETACLRGFYDAMDKCDSDTNEKKGGRVQYGAVKFYTYAKKATKKDKSSATSSPSPPTSSPAPSKAKDISCDSKKGDRELVKN
ncbi:MAG: hypothetical protein Q9225_005989 [Loekoesia sp. 1 TL-2023]